MTGMSINEYATIKYDSNGNKLWVARYNGPGDYIDRPSALAIDREGNVYVTGESYGDSTSYDYATVKYNSAGNELWVARYNGPGNNYDFAKALAVDSDGNVYVTGQSIGDDTDYDYATVKYDDEGKELWVERYNGPGGVDKAYALALDGTGNVYVTGYSDGYSTSHDYTTVKYSSAGNQFWVARYNGPVNGADYAYALAVDGEGNAYVTGRSRGGWTNSTYYDYATVKYDGEGNELWVARYDGPAINSYSYDCARALVVDGAGNVYVTGYSIGDSTAYDYGTVKYNSAGNELWVARYNGPGNDYDFPNALAVDGDGNVYVTGHSVGDGTNQDYATIKYDAEGDELWLARYNGPGNDDDLASALVLDVDGNVYVTGYSDGDGTHYDYATIKYSNGFIDADGDGYNSNVDCNDAESTTNPGASEVCDGVDNNCDGTIDEGVTTTFFADFDGDTYGDASETTEACTVPDGYVTNSDDLCPAEDSTGFDFDSDGCIDSLSGQVELVEMFLADGSIDELLRKSLIAKISNARNSFDRDNICTAINQLVSVINQVNALSGKKISDDAASETIAYANSVISYLKSLLPDGETCSQFRNRNQVRVRR